jgi:hypothetical protein
MFDKRQNRRKNASVEFGVYESDTDRFFGCLVDLSVEGVKLVSESEIDSDILYHFKMKLPEKVRGTMYVEFEARSRWCEQVQDSNSYETGFIFEDISRDDLEVVEALLDEPLFRFAEEDTAVTVIKKSI